MREVIEALPKSVTLLDGRRRTGSVRLWRLVRSWQGNPGGPEESQGAFDAYEGGDVLDVGAYEGWYSVLLAPKARSGDQFISFEPDARMFADLLATQSSLGRLFPDLRLWAVPQPVGDGSPTELQWPEEGVEGHPRFAGGAGDDAPPSMTIDRFVADTGLQPRFVKIDVEGAEWFVLRGMTGTLERHHPVVMLELHPHYLPDGVEPAAVEAILRDRGYTVTVAQEGDVSVRQVWRPPNGQPA